MNVSDQICTECRNSLEISFKFHSQFKESAELLRQFSKKFVISSNDGEFEYSDIIIESNDPVCMQAEEDIEIQDEPAESTDEELLEKVTNMEEESKHLHSTLNKPFKNCDVCGKSVKNLSVHMQIHSAKLQYGCSVCLKKFCNKERLKRHIRTHLGVRDKICNVCNKAFICSSSLGKHRQIHEKNMKYSCEVCNKKFYR